MTDEFPKPTRGSDAEPNAADRDPFTSLGIGLIEESPVIDTGTHTESPLIIDAAVLPPTFPSSESSELVSLSRRALREAEKSRASGRVTAAARVPALPPTPTASAAAPTPRNAPTRRPFARRIAQKSFPPTVMLVAAALLVGTSVPANALFDPKATPGSLAMSTAVLDSGEELDAMPEDQVLEAEAVDELSATAATRDEWTVTSYAQLLQLKYGSRSFSYTTTGTGAVRWPFPFTVPISSGFGERVAPCRGCSSYHQGLDFTPGRGAPIYSIAEGVVLRSEFSGGFGQHAIIEHVINGQRVTSTYAHMVGGSSPLVVGQQLLAGDFVGTVGSTGTSTGAHLHLEIRIDDIAIDPFQWLQSNAS